LGLPVAGTLAAVLLRLGVCVAALGLNLGVDIRFARPARVALGRSSGGGCRTGSGGGRDAGGPHGEVSAGVQVAFEGGGGAVVDEGEAEPDADGGGARGRVSARGRGGRGILRG